MKRKILIGVSWPYANGEIHLGHLAGQYVSCDVFARYHRLRGNDVLMVSGSDDHGAPIQFKAEEEGITPKELVSQSRKNLVKTYQDLNFLYENFTSTSTEIHKETVQSIFLVLKKHGYLIKKKSKQYWDPKVKRFLPDRYVRGTCPYCKNSNARGDECPECGKFLAPEELLEPRSTLSDATPILKETEHYYLDLPQFSKKLMSWLSTKKDWRKWVLEFSKGWIRNGLEPRPITRDMSWGIPVPEKGWEDKVIYVWFDAVIGYLSASIEWSENFANKTKLSWEDFWKNEKAEHYYFIAGGNVPFHTIIWPSQLIGYNSKYSSEKEFQEFKLRSEKKQKALNLPTTVVANKMLLLHGKKMSKGDNIGISATKLLKTYSADHIRYFALRYAPENHDTEFTWKDFIDANNNELVGIIGNFINRTLTFTKNNFGSKVPKASLDLEVAEQIHTAFKNIEHYVERTEFNKAIKELLKLGKFANKYFNDQTPWVSIKKDKKKAANTIYNSIQLVEAFRILLKPFLPQTAKTLSQMLNKNKEYDPNEEMQLKGYVSKKQDLWQFIPIPSGHQIKNPQILFKKVEYTKTQQQADIQNKKTKTKISSSKPQKTSEAIDFKLFQKIDLRVGLVKEATIPKWSKKLIKMRVNFGEKEKTIFGGLREWYKPEELIGQKFLFVYNLKPKKVGEGTSEGMILAAGEPPHLINIDDKVPEGTRLS